MLPVSTSTKSIQRLFSEAAGGLLIRPAALYRQTGNALLEVLYSIEPEVSTNSKTLGSCGLTSAWAPARAENASTPHSARRAQREACTRDSARPRTGREIAWFKGDL